MAQATSTEQPAVVLRSRFNHPRALVAVATVVLVGLTGAVAILMTDDQVDTGGGSENPLCALTSKERHRVEGLSSRSPAQLASSFGRATVPAPPPGTPYHGDPGIFGPPPSTPYDGDWGCLPVPPPRARFATEMQGEAGTSAAIAQSSGGTKFRGSKTS
jgi:hypothetical protein